MVSNVAIDEIDVKILYQLFENARVKIKDLAAICGLSSTAVINRIKRLKTKGVIKGSALYVDINQLGYLYPVSIRVENISTNQTHEVLKIIRNQTQVVIEEYSLGRSSLLIFLVAKSLQEIDYFKHVIRKRTPHGKIEVDLWKKPHTYFANITIQPTKL